MSVDAVTSKQSDVLINGATCGFWENPATIDGQEIELVKFANFRTSLIEDVYMASTMAATCQKNSSIASNCVSYSPKEIEWTSGTDITCPFDEKLCHRNKTVRFDSGHIDSTLHFGINAAKEDRVLHRIVVECSPLARKGYVSDWHAMGGTKLSPISGQDAIPTQSGELFQEWLYGPNIAYGLHSTYIYSNARPSTPFSTNPAFSIESVFSYLSVLFR